MCDNSANHDTVNNITFVLSKSMWFHQGPTEMLDAAQKLSCPEMCTHFANVIRKIRWTKTFFPKVSPNILYYFLGTKIADCLSAV